MKSSVGGGGRTAEVSSARRRSVGRHVLRGPRQINTDLAVSRRVRLKATTLEIRADFFNCSIGVNFANPISDISALFGSGGTIDEETGRVIDPGDFGRIVSTSGSPRIVQLAVKLTF